MRLRSVAAVAVAILFSHCRSGAVEPLDATSQTRKENVDAAVDELVSGQVGLDEARPHSLDASSVPERVRNNGRQRTCTPRCAEDGLACVKRSAPLGGYALACVTKRDAANSGLDPAQCGLTCGDGLVCVDDTGHWGTARCWKPCANDADCTAAELCNMAGSIIKDHAPGLVCIKAKR